MAQIETLAAALTDLVAAQEAANPQVTAARAELATLEAGEPTEESETRMAGLRSLLARLDARREERRRKVEVVTKQLKHAREYRSRLARYLVAEQERWDGPLADLGALQQATAAVAAIVAKWPEAAQGDTGTAVAMLRAAPDRVRSAQDRLARDAAELATLGGADE